MAADETSSTGDNNASIHIYLFAKVSELIFIFFSSITLRRYCPYWFLIIGWAISRILSSVIQPFLYAIASRHAILSPWRFSITSTKVDASERLSWVPVSSHANPRPSVCTFSSLSLRKTWFTEVISYSPRADGLIFLATSTTLLG